MKFITLTSHYNDFEISRNDSQLQCIWKGPVDFSQFATVGLYDFQIYLMYIPLCNTDITQRLDLLQILTNLHV